MYRTRTTKSGSFGMEKVGAVNQQLVGTPSVPKEMFFFEVASSVPFFLSFYPSEKVSQTVTQKTKVPTSCTQRN